MALPTSSPALDPQWREMTLPHYLKELRLNIQETWEKSKATTAEAKSNFKKLQRSGDAANIADAKKFLRDSVSIIVKLLRREKVEEAGVLGDASQVALAIRNEEELLRLIAPDFSVNPSGRWPGPVGYRSALNHLIAVSIRVHSMYPETKFDVILRASARRILVPALAHNLTFLRRSAPSAFNFILKSQDGIDRIEGGRVIDDIVAGRFPEDEVAVAEAWIRLLNATLLFARRSVVDAPQLFAEIKRLTLEHEINPTGSALWNELSLIASGDLSIDELLVSRVTTDLQDKLGAAPPRPIVFCARARFGLLRYSYAMIEERELIAKQPMKALADASGFLEGLLAETGKGEKLSDEASIRAFGWAYLWSRYLLLGRADDKRMDAPDFRESQDQAGCLLEDLLFQVHRHAEKLEYRQLALRYITGFLTNPRFVRPKSLRSANHRKAREYIGLMETECLPGGLISMMQARLQLHDAYASQGQQVFGPTLHAALATYAETLKSISASEHSDNMMDGEVAAWAIPEMRFAVELLKQTVTEKGNVRKSKLSEFERIQKALDMIGEMQFGVYFNQEEEAGRLDKGLRLGCDELG